MSKNIERRFGVILAPLSSKNVFSLIFIITELYF